MDRGDYDFAGSNLVNNILIKSLGNRVSSVSTLGLLGTCYLYPLGSLGN